MASIAGKDFFLTQFIRFQGLLLDDAISCIFSSKKSLLAEYMFALNSFQYCMSPETRYLFRLSVHSEFHHSLECLVICLSFELDCQVCSKMAASCWIIFFKSSFATILEVSKFLTLLIIKEMKLFSSLLSLLMDHLLISILIP